MERILSHLDKNFQVKDQDIYPKTGRDKNVAKTVRSIAGDMYGAEIHTDLAFIEKTVTEWLNNKISVADDEGQTRFIPHTLTDDDKKLIGGVRWATSEDGVPLLFGMINAKTNTYKPINSIDAYLRGTYRENGESYYKAAHARYVQILSKCDGTFRPPLAGLWKMCKTTRTDNGAIRVTMPSIQFTDYLESVSELLLSDPTLQIKFPLNLSNCKETPNCHYVDLSNLVKGDIWAWEEWETQLPTEDHRHIWRAWVYSIADSECKDHHALWLHGGGGNAKSTSSEALMCLVGGQHMVAGLSPTIFDNHQNVQLVGKRLGIDGDVKNPMILSKGEMHKICTGMDLVNVNPKGDAPYSIKMYMRMLFIANVPPMIDMSKDSERRRLIYLKMCPYPEHIAKKVYWTDENGNFVRDSQGRLKQKGNSQFGEALKAQIWSYLAYCKESYEMLKPDGATQLLVPDVVTEDMYMHIYDDLGMRFETIIDDAFELDPEGWIECNRLSEYLRTTEKMNNFQQNDFYAWLEKTYPVSKSRKRIGDRDSNNRPRVYNGIKLKGNTPKAYVPGKPSAPATKSVPVNDIMGLPHGIDTFGDDFE